MVPLTEDGTEILSGWPLGLEVMNSRLRMADPERLRSRFSLHLQSMSFSSLSSSELDTVSSASFFQDHSVSLGRLIGIRSNDKRWRYLPKSAVRSYENERISVNAVRLDGPKENSDEISRRICIPLLFGIILKMISSKFKKVNRSYTMKN